MDAGQESKGITENAEDSDDPDSACCQNEKRRGRFLIEEVEEENQYNYNQIEYMSEDNYKDVRSQSLFLKKKYNFSINTIEYHGETSKNQEDKKGSFIIGYIFDNKSNNFTNSEKILNLKQNSEKVLLIYNYIDIYPHLFPEDCRDCKNQCNCSVNADNFAGNQRQIHNANEASVINANNGVSYPRKISEKEDEDIEESFIEEKAAIKQNLPLSSASIKNEYEFLTASSRKDLSPFSCRVHSGKFYKKSSKKSFDNNFSLIKEEKFLNSSPRIKFNPIKIDDDKINRICSSSKLLFRTAERIKSSRKFIRKSFENSFRPKLYLGNISKRHYSADFPSDFKEFRKDEIVGRNFDVGLGNEKEKIFYVEKESFKISYNCNTNFSMCKSISFSFFNSVAAPDKICGECTQKISHNFCN